LSKKLQRNPTKTANLGVARIFYGARYLDPKTSRWISADPAMGEYIPQAPINDEAKKSNKTLPGMGGVFNYVNFHVYHYAGNNPIKLVDPDGEKINPVKAFFVQNSGKNNILDMGSAPTYDNNEDLKSRNTIGRYGCLFTAVINIGDTIRMAAGESIKQVSDYSGTDSYYQNVEKTKTLEDGTTINTGTDRIMGPSEIKVLLNDMTGGKFYVRKVSGNKQALLSINQYSKSNFSLKWAHAYLIADVGTNGNQHFVNVQGVDEDGNILVHNPDINGRLLMNHQGLKVYILSKNYKDYLRLITSFIVFFVVLVSCPGKNENKLLERTIDVSSLYNAFDEENVSAIVELLKSGGNSYNGQPLIIMATLREWDEGVIALFDNGADPYCKSKEENLFFNLAIHKLQENTLIFLIDNGFDVMEFSEDEIVKFFKSAIFVKKAKLQRRMLDFYGFTKVILPHKEISIDFMRYWTEGTDEVLDELVKRGFVLPDDSSLYFYAINENCSYKAVEWLISHGFTMSALFEGETISYWADLNLSRSRKSYDDSDPPSEDSPGVSDAKKKKELIDTVLSTN